MSEAVGHAQKRLRQQLHQSELVNSEEQLQMQAALEQALWHFLAVS